jgi:membrane protease YdiL (CAAX protease family)
MDQIETTSEATPTSKPAPGLPGIWGSIGWVILFLVLQLLFSVAAIATKIAITGIGDKPVTDLTGDLSYIALPTVWALILSNLSFLGLMWLYLRRHNRLSLIGVDRWSPKPVFYVVGVAIAVIIAGIGFNYLYSTYVIPGVEMQDEIRRMFASIPKTAFNSVLLFLAVAVVAPLVEELLFRGILQNSLAKHMPIWVAIALASAIFAAMHMQLTAFPALMVIGASFGLLYHLTGSLRVNILVHMLNNAAALLLT